MKIVLSRKGFDSQNGGVPSPILPDGRLVSFPIPLARDRYTFDDLKVDDLNVGTMVEHLSSGRFNGSSRIHLDPDLRGRELVRQSAWRPALGQAGAAQSHLAAQGVGPGDVMLFFGWFREVEEHKGRWRYCSKAPDLHVLFGWIEIEAVLAVGADRATALAEYPAIEAHPHVQTPARHPDPRNVLYVGSATSRFRTVAAGLGGGMFSRYTSALCLTAAESSRSIWALPSWFEPSAGRKPLSYHGKPELWEPAGDRVRLRSVAKGQEFVLDTQHYPEALPWLHELIRTHSVQ